MTQIDEPNLDKEIHGILESLAYDYTDGATYYASEKEIQSDISEATKTIKALIATQIQEARVDELRRIPRTNYGNDFTIHIKAYLDSRIKELGE